MVGVTVNHNIDASRPSDHFLGSLGYNDVVAQVRHQHHKIGTHAANGINVRLDQFVKFFAMEGIDVVAQTVNVNFRRIAGLGDRSGDADISDGQVAQFAYAVCREYTVVGPEVGKVAEQYLGVQGFHHVVELFQTVVELMIAERDIVISDLVHYIDGIHTVRNGYQRAALRKIAQRKYIDVRSLAQHLFFQSSHLGIAYHVSVYIVIEKNDNVFLFDFDGLYVADSVPAIQRQKDEAIQ